MMRSLRAAAGYADDTNGTGRLQGIMSSASVVGAIGTVGHHVIQRRSHEVSPSRCPTGQFVRTIDRRPNVRVRAAVPLNSSVTTNHKGGKNANKLNIGATIIVARRPGRISNSTEGSSSQVVATDTSRDGRVDRDVPGGNGVVFYLVLNYFGDIIRHLCSRGCVRNYEVEPSGDV